MFRHCLIIGTLAVSLIASPAHSKSARLLGLRAIQTVVGITDPTSTLVSEQVPINFGSSKAATSVQQQPISVAQSISVGVQEYGVGTLTKEDIISNAKTAMNRTKADSIGQAIKAMVAQDKVGSGVFIFEQEVRPLGATSDMKLTWSVTVTDGGQIISGAPKIADQDPTLVYMLYTSMAAETGLPTSWKWTDAGILQWQLRRSDGTPTTAWTRIDTGGAFDEDASDAELKINCLADKTIPTCPTSYPDGKTLMADTASMAVIIDYVRKVAPVYDQSLDPDTSETIYTPQMSINYDKREYDRTGCSSGNYRNTGRKGYTLNTTIDRYQLLETDTSPVRINRYQGTSLSPTENFDISKTLDMSSAALKNLVLDTFNPDSLVNVSSIPGLQFVAPIINQSTITNTNNIRIESTQNDMLTSWVPGGNGSYSLYLGTVADNYWSGWGTAFDRSMTFNISNKDLYTKFTLAYAAFDDWLLVQINGHTVYVGPYGGDRLEKVQRCSERGDRGTVCDNYIQYGPNSFGGYELDTNWAFNLNVDLRPYLQAGQNTIFMRTLVAGNGEGAIRIDANSCLAEE